MQDTKKRLSPFALVLFFLIGVAGIALAIRNTAKCADQVGNARLSELAVPLAESDTQALISRISRMVSVPLEGVPTIATVQDVEQLRAQNPAFYDRAENGDRVVAWPEMLVLYSTKKDIVLIAMPVKTIPTDVVTHVESTSTTP